VSAYTQSAAVISAQPGSTFNLMNGSITGEMLTVVQNEKLVQKWRLKHWPADVYSTVTLMLFQVDASTLQVPSSPPSPLPSHQNQNRIRKRFAHARRRLSLSQSGVPHMDAQGNTDVIDNVKRGWQSRLFER